MFDGSTYLQLQGTAMGTPMAVTYANLVLFYLEKASVKLPYLLYLRYIDDLFLLAPPDTATTFISRFCDQVESIQLDGITMGERGVFLDLDVKIKEGRLIYKTYQKEINKYLYIPPHSNHSLSSLRNIIRNEIRRYRLCCQEDNDYLEIKNLFFHRLLRRGYKPRLLLPLFKEKVERKELLNKVLKKDSNHQLVNRKLVATLSIPNIRIIGLRSLFVLPESISSTIKYQRIYGKNDKVTLGRKHGRNTLNYFLHRALPPDEIISSGDDQSLEEPAQPNP